MAIERVFLPVDRPALPQVIEHLIERYQRDDQLNLASTIAVLPGRRAGRRLLELLVEACEERNLLLSPPEIDTVGLLPDRLYTPQRPFANELTQDLAWARALRSISPDKLQPAIPVAPSKDDDDRWLELGQVFRRQHAELAGDGLDFRDVARRGPELEDFDETARWRAMAEAQDAYHRLLDSVGLWDLQTARLVAIDKRKCQTDKDVLLIGAVDMNVATRSMLDQVADQVTAFIFAPPEWSERFDEHGCLRTETWDTSPIEIDMNRVRVVGGPGEQAESVLRIIASYDGRYRADEITIGVPDDRIVPDITRMLDLRELPSRWGPGKTLSETGPHTLLSAVADYSGRQHFRDFAALVRHPDIGRWLAQHSVHGDCIHGDWLAELDKYQAEHLPYRLTGRWLGPASASQNVRLVFDAIQQLIAPLTASHKPLAEWGDLIISLLTEVFGWRELDRSLAQDRGTLAACEAMRDAISAHLAISSALAPTVSASRAMRWTLEQTAGQPIPPPAEADAIELLGWLELPLDDAPAVIITSLNEGFIPESVDSDLFLPNRLRSRLGLLDNLRRYARDAYALSVLSAARDDCHIIVARRNHEGDPLVPSRLLFAADRRTIAERARLLFATTSDKPAPLVEPTRPSEAAADGLAVPQPFDLAEPIERMSVTSFRDYIACPYRFYLRHVLRLRPLDDHADELDGAAFGSLAHEILHRFGERPERESTDAEQIRQTLYRLLNQTVAKQYGRDAMAVIHVQVEQLRMRLDAFAEKQAEWASAGWRIEFTEVPTNDHQHAELVVDGEAMPLTGRIDRIDVNRSTGQRVVFDYKTSDAARRPRDAHQKRGEWIDLQLPLYRHLVRTLEIDGPVEFGYILLPKDTSRIEYCLAKWTDEELAEADTIAADVVRAVRQTRFWPPTDPPPAFSEDFAYICQDNVL
ncbi:MAG: hypothetical protein CMJ64_26795 [Planctomycetaceae bacterium]|nr:hypothetical protein [Planctomycetaceae bacterium]